MKTNLKILTTILAFTFLITSCKKDNHQPANQQTFLKKASTSSSVITYEYDENKRVREYEVSFTTSPANNYTVLFTYNSSDQLTEVYYDVISTSNDTKNIFTYNASGQITKIETYLVSGGVSTLDSKSQADYSTPGKIAVYFTPYGGTPYLNVEYFLDAKGNNIKQLDYSPAGPLLVTTENSDYDDKHSPSLMIPKLGFAKSVNNYQTVTVTVTGDSPSVGTYVYEYNSDGYPTKRTSNTGAINTYEYIKM